VRYGEADAGGGAGDEGGAWDAEGGVVGSGRVHVVCRWLLSWYSSYLFLRVKPLFSQSGSMEKRELLLLGYASQVPEMEIRRIIFSSFSSSRLRLSLTASNLKFPCPEPELHSISRHRESSLPPSCHFRVILPWYHSISSPRSVSLVRPSLNGRENPV
jgi:hypothetical protein